MRWLSIDFGMGSVLPAAVTPLRSTTLHKIEAVVQVQHAIFILHHVGRLGRSSSGHRHGRHDRQ